MEIAKKGNCIIGSTHLFIKVRGGYEEKEIRLKLPQLKLSLWVCRHCNKVTEST